MRYAFAVIPAVAVLLAATALATAGLKPVLRLGTADVVRGSLFKPHELVRVVFTSDVRRVRVIRVSATGSFAAALPAPAGSCVHMLIRATGASGDIASIALPKVLCPPPSSSGQSAVTTPTSDAGSPTSSAGGLPDQHGPATINAGG